MATNPYIGGEPVLNGVSDAGETDVATNIETTNFPEIATWTNDLTVPVEVYAEIRLGSTANPLASAAAVISVRLTVTPSGGEAYESVTAFTKEAGTTEAEMTKGIIVPGGNGVLTVDVQSDIANTPAHWCILRPTPGWLPLGVVMAKTTGAGSATTMVCSGLSTYATDAFNGARVVVMDGTYKGARPYITDFDGTDTITHSALPAAAGSGVTIKIV